HDRREPGEDRQRAAGRGDPARARCPGDGPGRGSRPRAHGWWRRSRRREQAPQGTRPQLDRSRTALCGPSGRTPEDLVSTLSRPTRLVIALMVWGGAMVMLYAPMATWFMQLEQD